MDYFKQKKKKKADFYFYFFFLLLTFLELKEIKSCKLINLVLIQIFFSHKFHLDIRKSFWENKISVIIYSWLLPPWQSPRQLVLHLVLHIFLHYNINFTFLTFFLLLLQRHYPKFKVFVMVLLWMHYKWWWEYHFLWKDCTNILKEPDLFSFCPAFKNEASMTAKS